MMVDNVVVIGPSAPPRGAAVVVTAGAVEVRGTRLLNGSGEPATLVLNWDGAGCTAGGQPGGRGGYRGGNRRCFGGTGWEVQQGWRWAGRGAWLGRRNGRCLGCLGDEASRGMKLTLLAVCVLWPGLGWAAERWDSYQVIMWQDRTPAQLAGLRALGFTAARVRATGGDVDRARRAAVELAGLGFYLENVATDFYSPYHRYTPGKAVTWLFDAAKARLRAGDLRAFEREPSLSDAAWLETHPGAVAGRGGAGARDAVRQPGG